MRAVFHHAAHWRGWRRALQLVILALIAFLILTFLVLIPLLFFGPGDRTFTLAAETEKVSIALENGPGSSARLPRVSYGDSFAFDCVDCTLRVNAGATLTLSRRREGDIFATVQGKNATESVARVEQGSAVKANLLPGDAIRISLDVPRKKGEVSQEVLHTMLLPFAGDLTVGDDPGRAVSWVLQSAKISVYERERLSNERFLVKEISLEHGDVIRWEEPTAATISFPVIGFVQIGNSDGIEVVANSSKRQMKVERYGAAGYSICPTIFDRAGKGPLTTAAAALAGFLSALVGCMSLVIQFGRKLFSNAPDAQRDVSV